MSTYSDSKYVIARKDYECCIKACPNRIVKGTRHLAYKPGLHSTSRVCMSCSRAKNRDDYLLFDCAAVRAELGVVQRTSHPQRDT